VKQLPILINVDVEPDDREVAGDPESDWSATAPCVREMERFRETVQQSTGRPVHFNWYLRVDPQIAEAYGRADYPCVRFERVWERCRRAGDSFGVHVHAWRATSGNGWLVDHGNREWVRRCIRQSFDAFARSFGHPPQTFRFGDRFSSNDVVRTIEALGFRYDLTLEPGRRGERALRTNEASTGALPDYRRVPRRAYRPSRLDYRRPGRWRPRALWMVPVSTGCPYERVVLPRRSRGFMHLNFAGEHSAMRRLFDALSDRPDTAHVAWVARTGDYANEQYRAHFDRSLEFLAQHPRRHEFCYVRPDEVWMA
jgi:hypothetical protein